MHIAILIVTIKNETVTTSSITLTTIKHWTLVVELAINNIHPLFYIEERTIIALYVLIKAEVLA